MPTVGLRPRLLLLVLLALLPALFLIIYSNAEQRRSAVLDAEADAVRLVRVVATHEGQLTEVTRQLLLLLAQLPEVRGRDPVVCSARLAELLQVYPYYALFAVAEPEGNVICSALPLTEPVNVADRGYFQRALATRAFAVGEHQIGRITGRATINFGHPLLTGDEEVEGVVFAALDLAWVNAITAETPLPPGTTLTIIDRQGTILARHPEPDRWVGQMVPEAPLVQTILAQREGTQEIRGLDDVPRLYAFTPLGRGEGDAYVSIGIPAAVAYANANRALVRNLVGLGLVAILALGTAWFGGNAFILSPVNRLLHATRRLSAGDLSARAGLANEGSEIGQLALAFDEMASSLQKRELDRQHYLQTLQENQKEIRRLNEDLERRVIERTAQLEAANQALEQARQEADQARDDAQQASRAKSAFLSRMSHELRTPMNAILGFAQLLQMDSLSPEQRTSVAQILKSGRHLLDLINEVLDIARIEAGHYTISLEPVRVAEALQETMDLVRPLAEQRQVQVVGLPEGCRGHILADRQRLKQVLLNLLSNAIKYNRQEGLVTLLCEERPGVRLRISVSDTGMGIAPEKLARLFVPFERLGVDQSAIEGTGLGLALSKGLVEAMGGQMGVTSAAGEGSTFWLELPCVDGAPDEVVQVMGDNRVPEDILAPQSCRVLYIEDNPSNLKLIERVLARRPGVQLLTAMQGQLGLDLAREHRPDAILLDLHLPDLPGEEVLRRLWADPSTRAIPVVVLSADATKGQVQRLRAAGARDYLTKPLDIQRFLTVLDELLQESE